MGKPTRAGFLRAVAEVSMTLLKTHAEAVEIGGKRVQCLMCGHEAFHRRKTHFDTALASGMAPAWSESEGYCLICDRCGYVHGFVSVRR